MSLIDSGLFCLLSMFVTSISQVLGVFNAFSFIDKRCILSCEFLDFFSLVNLKMLVQVFWGVCLCSFLFFVLVERNDILMHILHSFACHFPSNTTYLNF